MNMVIVVDERETEIWTHLHFFNQEFKTPLVTLQKRVLPLGDALIQSESGEDLLLIERKSLPDLLASIKDGRYEEQSYRLAHASGINHPHNIVYVLEGLLSQLRSETDRKLVFSCTTSLQYFKGFSVARTSTSRETAEYLLRTADKMGRDLQKGKTPWFLRPKEGQEKEGEGEGEGEENDKGKSSGEYCTVVKKVKKQNVTPQNIGEIVLCQIPGISSASAMAIMKKYDSSFPAFMEAIVAQGAAVALADVYLKIDGVKKRKLNKSCILHIEQYFTTRM